MLASGRQVPTAGRAFPSAIEARSIAERDRRHAQAQALGRPALKPLCAGMQTLPFARNSAPFGYTEINQREDAMSFIDSPISRCEAVREMVLTDQTQRQCDRARMSARA